MTYRFSVHFLEKLKKKKQHHQLYVHYMSIELKLLYCIFCTIGLTELLGVA